MFGMGIPFSSRAVYCISYDTIIPCLSSSIGGCQVTKISVGDSANASVSVGGPPGATINE